jgi:hypothetical protein
MFYFPTNPDNSSCSQYTIYDASQKKNDLDSISVNGKYYYNIFNTFDYSGTCFSGGIITNISYAKKVGIIRFTYNGMVYDII